MAAQPSFEDAGKYGKEFFDNNLKTFAAISKGVQAVAVETGEYAKKSFEAGAATFEKLVSAKSLEKAIEIQTDFAKASYEGFVAQATKIGELYTDLGKEIYKPYEALAAKVK